MDESIVKSENESRDRSIYENECRKIELTKLARIAATRLVPNPDCDASRDVRARP